MTAAPSIWSANVQTLLSAIGPLMAAAILFSILLVALFHRVTGKRFLETLVFVSPFAWLGAACGFIAGSSKEELIGALLTGVLTVAGTLITYLFGQDSTAEWRRPLPLAMMLLFLCTLAGITSGKAQQAKWDDFAREYAKWQKDYETITLPVRAAKQRFDVCVKFVTPAERPKCDAVLTGAKPASGS
ncbi:MAG TPA: hypothetical protein VN029_14055 [Sphingomonas sp.]|nr:hypothetical protein [Sphingomonas sp.]